DFWNDHGLPQNILTDYLASNPDDTRAEGALKNAIESLGLGAVVGSGIFLGAKLLRALKGTEKSEVELTKQASGEQTSITSLEDAETGLLTGETSPIRTLPKALRGNNRYTVENDIEYVRFTTGPDAGA